MSPLILAMGIVAIVLTLAALTSRVVERAPVSFPIIFLGIGLLLGSYGVVDIDLHSPLLEAVAIISLALVLFLDAVNIQIDELKREWYVPVATLGPGTLLTIIGVSLAAFYLMGVTPLQAVLLGAVLSSTDPVVLRDIVRDVNVPRSVRRALSIEAGMNDLVVLPIVLVLIALLTAQSNTAWDWANFLSRILVLSPLIGLAVGGVGAYVMGKVDASVGIGREYQALYGIGLVLASFAAAQSLGGDGFLAAFFGGLAITLFNVTLCDCFMEYGEVTAEMMMLLAFVLFGAVLSSLLTTVPLISGLALAVVSLLIVRPAAFTLVLLPAKMSNLARGFIGWFGPRGLNSLLLALLAVQAHVPGAEYLLAITGFVVVVSVVLHGTSATPLSAWYGRRVAEAIPTLAEEREGTFVGLFEEEPQAIPLISTADLATALQSEHPPVVLDVRSRARYESVDTQIPTSIRVLPDQIGDWAVNASNGTRVVVYCSCPDDATSLRVARQLLESGFKARALHGGFDAWAAEYPLEPKGTPALPTPIVPIALEV
jgi:NhaP-type Na+/H+ or K+/H+ antiporter/rhodanese-related sulfurtransferase